jgi:hypothetical protein
MPLRPASFAALPLLSLVLAAPDAAPPAPEADRAALRGVGVLIIDPLDSPDQVRERLRQFVMEARANVPPEQQREEVRRQVDALLSAPADPDAPLPQIRIVFQPGMTAARVLSYMENTPSARASRELCPASCPVTALYHDGMHVHLTRPYGGLGDSVFAISFEGGGEAAAVAEAAARRRSLLERYPVGAGERRPIGTVFGVSVYLGEPIIPESSRVPE